MSWAGLGWAGGRQCSLGSSLFVMHHKSVMYVCMHSVVNSLYMNPVHWFHSCGQSLMREECHRPV